MRPIKPPVAQADTGGMNAVSLPPAAVPHARPIADAFGAAAAMARAAQPERGPASCRRASCAPAWP